MALGGKTSGIIHDKTGNDKKALKEQFDNRKHSDLLNYPAEAALIYQLQLITEDIDEVRRHLTQDIGDGSGGAGNIYGNKIKISPTEFMTNDDVSYNRALIEDDISSKFSVRVGHSAAELYAFVFLPEGKTATHVDVYASTSVSVTLYEVNLTTGDRTTKMSGNANSTMTLDTGRTNYEVAATANNYLAIKLNVTSITNYIYGAMVTIA
jgi:hypothetical protein|tara:strand:+ start:590 stop:1216 length:627 start_codon:yes stop_codon:yes gene_type:complete